MIDTRGIIYVLRLITSASHLTTFKPCYTIQMPALLARDESQQPSRRNRAGFVLSSEDMMGRKIPVEERFWTKVQKTDGCWVWTSVLNEKGYGILVDTVDGKQKRLRAHRLVWKMSYGSIPEGMQVCHECDNPSCVRPDHLFLGTNKENTQDKVNKGRAPRGDDHWMKKHPERIPRGDRSSTRLHPESYGKGADSPFAKLTREQVKDIRDEYATRRTFQRIIAKRYGVEQTTISKVVRRARYNDEE